MFDTFKHSLRSPTREGDHVLTTAGHPKRACCFLFAHRPCRMSDDLVCVPQDLAKLDELRSSVAPHHKSVTALLHELEAFETKLRPGVFDFLNALKDCFQLYIYTMGDEVYACSMASLLDPKGNLFRNRIINRADSDWAQHQKGLAKLGLDPSMTIVVDDTPGAPLI
jgi:NLI interacting factor-like phosphatase